ncbi:HAMP domain-containing sensor histidine kinase [Pseudomonas aeruginosa]|nr:HAMP domain-containing sensor histidine kinase [Pseudomonas aeruginosa]
MKDTDIHENVEPVGPQPVAPAHRRALPGRWPGGGRRSRRRSHVRASRGAQALYRQLLDDALEYGERARLSLEDGPEAVVLHVDDDGPGVPEQRLEQIFEPRFRLSPRGQGCELGLEHRGATSRNTHGGEVSLQNRREGGLRVSLRLPRLGLE